MEGINVYVRSNNNKNIIILNGDRQSFRCRQRGYTIDGIKTPSLKFISYKEMLKDIKKTNKNLIGPIRFNSISKL